MLPLKVILPGVRGLRAGFLAMIVDVSGSVTQQELSGFVTGIREVLASTHPQKLLMLVTDYKVLDALWLAGPSTIPVPTAVKGYGGTDMRKGFDWLTEHDLKPDLILVLTDMETPFPDSPAPGKDAIWISCRPGQQWTGTPPGRVVTMT